MKQKRHKHISAIFVFLLRGNEILLLRRFNTGYSDGNYGLPSGHLDPHETIRNATAREAKEEVGININPRDLELVLVQHRGSDDERIHFYFKAKKWEGEPYNVEPDKCDDVRWFPIDKLPENIILYVKVAIKDYVAGKNYNEFGWK